MPPKLRLFNFGVAVEMATLPLCKMAAPMRRSARRAWMAVLLALLWVSSTAAVTHSERGALKLFFWATHGQRWAFKWDIQNEYSDPCLDSWYGIVCDRYGRIRAIRLASNNLVGILPTEFPRLGLSSLQELDLSSNFLTGNVPDTLSRLTALRMLRLDRNFFVGAVPASLATLQKLEFLELQENNFDPVDENGGVLPEQIQQLAGSSGHSCHIMS